MTCDTDRNALAPLALSVLLHGAAFLLLPSHAPIQRTEMSPAVIFTDLVSIPAPSTGEVARPAPPVSAVRDRRFPPLSRGGTPEGVIKTEPAREPGTGTTAAFKASTPSIPAEVSPAHASSGRASFTAALAAPGTDSTSVRNAAGAHTGNPLAVPSGPPGAQAGGDADGGRERGVYLETIRGLIERRKEYPAEARRRGFEGTVVVRFVVAGNGEIRDVTLVRASSKAILDAAALRTVRGVGVLPPLPRAFGGREAVFDIPITFRLGEQ